MLEVPSILCPAMDSLGHVASWQLDSFHSDYLQPDEEFVRRAGKEIDRICSFLQRRCFQDGPWGDIKVVKVVKGGSLGKGTSMKNGRADLKLLLNIFNCYGNQEKARKEIIKEIERKLLLWQVLYPSDAVLVLFLDVIKTYADQEKDQKRFIKVIEKRLEKWHDEPYLSDADLQLISDIFKSYVEQEKDWKKILEEIARQLEEYPKESRSSAADTMLFLGLLKIYRDQEKDRKTMVEEIERHLGEWQTAPYLSDADLVIFLNIFQSYADQEEERKMILEEIERRLREWQEEPYISEVDVGQLVDLLKSYGDQEKHPEKITEEIGLWLRQCQEELHLSRADMGFLLDLLQRYRDQREDQKLIFQEMEKWFEECKENTCLELIFEEFQNPNPRALQFKLRSKKSLGFIEFDVLPTYNALGRYDGSKPDPQIYVDLIRTGKSGEFSTCFTELQRDFIVDRPTKLKDLIRLVKHWYKEVEETSFPPKYALELLTVYAWEQGSRETKFDTAEGFRTVLWLIENYKKIRIYWTKYYNFDNEIIKRYLQEQLSKNRPVILDPADPTTNLGKGDGWDQLAIKAKNFTFVNCCRKRDGSLVQPWNVPLAKQVPWDEEECRIL